MPGGAGKRRDTYTETLAGANLVIVADQDEPGINHAASVAAKLVAAGCHVDVVRPAAGKDAGDHLEAGHGLGEFIAETATTPNCRSC
jgi:DNA primase